MKNKIQVEKWYLKKINEKAKPELKEIIGLDNNFMNRKKKSKFSIIRFIKYQFHKMV